MTAALSLPRRLPRAVTPAVVARIEAVLAYREALRVEATMSEVIRIRMLARYDLDDALLAEAPPRARGKK